MWVSETSWDHVGSVCGGADHIKNTPHYTNFLKFNFGCSEKTRKEQYLSYILTHKLDIDYMRSMRDLNNTKEYVV